MYIVGIDGGLVNTGVVILDEKFNLHAAHTIKVKSTSAARLVDIETELYKILEPYLRHSYVEVFIEGYAFGAAYQRESLAELGGVLRRFFHISGIPYWVIDPKTVKLFVTGTGTAGKNLMIKKTKEKWGQSFKTDHECDAYGLARIGVNVITSLSHHRLIPNDLDIKEAEVIIDIVDNLDHFRLANTASRRKTKKQRYAKRDQNPKS